MILNVFFTSCTKTGSAILSGVVGSEAYDEDCDGEDIFLDSLFLTETTRSMMPYKDVTNLSFSNESGEVVNFNSQEGEKIRHGRIIIETYCTNFLNQRSKGYDIAEYTDITFKGILPTGEELEIRAFMGIERTWYSDEDTEIGNYETFRVYINDSQKREAQIARIPWMDTKLNREDISTADLGEFKSSVTLAGQEYTDVYVGQKYQTELKIYLKAGIGIIAFETAEGELFVIQ